MMNINIKIKSDRARDAFRAAPAVMERHVDSALGRGAQEIARQAQQRVPKFLSTLWTSIRALRLQAMRWRVTTGTNYARAVEEGTKPGYLPNPVHLRLYVKQKVKISFGKTTAGTKQRKAQYDEVRDRAWALARSIQKKGTKAHPYMKPAAEANTPRVHLLVEQAVDRGLREVFGA